MKFPQAHTLQQIAELLDIEFVGAADHVVTGMNEIHVVTPGDIVFVDHPKYYNKALESAATTVLMNKAVDCPVGKGLLVCDHPFDKFNELAQHFVDQRPRRNYSQDFPGSHVEDSATVGDGTIIRPGVVIGADCKVGKNCYLHPGVVLGDRTELGDNVILHPNVVLGGDAFYYKKKADGYHKLLSTGSVLIEDDCEIGAGTTIDRGVTGITTIGAGSKIDNQVQIGHDTIIGKRALIAAHAGIAGCNVIGDDFKAWGNSGMSSGLTIGNNVELLAFSGVSKDIPDNTRLFGQPAIEARKKFKELAAIRQLPRLLEESKR